MLKKLLLTLCIVLTSWSLALAQQGRLKGVITDKDTGEPIAFANVVLENGGTQVGGASTDFDGNYDINPIPPGTYDLRATFVGYNTFLMKGVVIPGNKITFQPIQMSMQSEMLETVEIVDYKVPLISKDQTSGGATITAEEIAKMPNRSAEAVAATVGGVFSADGEVGNMRGARSDGTVYYIDGVRVIGQSSVPQSAIDQVEVILSGTPAMYGDVTGGIISMTTRGPSRTFGAGLEIEQSIDGYGHTRAGINVQGPLIKGKKSETALLGFFLSGEFTRDKDGAISAIGHYKATNDWLNTIENQPLVLASDGQGVYPLGEFTRLYNMQYVKNSQNTAGWATAWTGNINIRTTETINLTFGGSFNKSRDRNFSRNQEYFNFDKNFIYDQQTWRVYGRFTQRFPTDPESNSLIKNFYYSLQVDFTRYDYKQYDPDHKKDIWKYGYLGKYTVYKTPSYTMDTAITVNGHTYNNVWHTASWDYDTLVQFQASDYNPLLARYTTTVFDLYNDPEGHYTNFDELQLNQGLLNSSSPSSFYGLYAAPGSIQANYGYNQRDQFNVNLSTAMSLGNHELKLGLQYEQRNYRGYSVNGYSMWYLMRNLANFHIDQLDIMNPEIVSYDGFVDTVKFYRLYNAADQYQFDKNLRSALGLNVTGVDWINTDSYDFNNNTVEYYDKDGVMHTAQLNTDGFDISMFTPDELTQGGTEYVSYYGYDYKGKKLKKQPSFEDFFTEVDENGNYTRPVGSYRPIYMAGYIQDKFAFKDLIFNVGIRVDRFDANQKVLKDPYILYDYYTVGDKRSDGKITLPNGETATVPGNIGDDYAVYVDNIKNITQIMGYRNDNTWYDANGAEISDPTTLNAGSGVTAWVKDKDQSHVDVKSFKDYSPQWSVMPRISFSFPISDEALFFAHYDVMTQRPSNIQTNIYDYYYFEQNSSTLNNPALKPSQTIDYELGFTQKLTNSSSMTITAYYNELRNMIQMYRYTGAYPKDYTSYSNLDFGTVKGLTASYDLRRTKNVRLRASYTLQYTNATGASTTTMSALIAAGVPNLRSTFPMPWDRRHQFNVTLDYRFADGKDYNGPVTKREGKKPIQWLANTGVSITMQGGSGTPYTASSNINSPISPGTNLLKGSYYGSRLPWAFRFDLRLDKDINLKLGGGKDGEKRPAYLNVYLQVLNLFNAKNVIGVYSSTGNPDDDGYLSAPEWQREIANQTNADSYSELYRLYVNNFYNYSAPRQVRIGLIFNF